jgi:hypothetical protein
MPIGSLHRRKFKTNLAILAAIAAWVALIWVIAMVKMGGGAP